MSAQAPKLPEGMLYLVNDKDEVHGVQLSLEAWLKVEDVVRKRLGVKTADDPVQKPEPIADWNTLTEYWDFKYPVNLGVECSVCGDTTENWLEDEPRKFWLTACNLGGLVTYRCLKCKAKVTKRFFKDEITFDAKPFQEEKDHRKDAFYYTK